MAVEVVESVKPDEPAEAEASYPARWRAWWSVIVLTLLLCLSLLDRQIMSLLVPDMRRELGLTDFQMGLLQGLYFSLFYGTFGLLFGWIIDRYSRRWVIYLGVSFWSLATAACGLSANFIQLMLARFGVGAGESALNPAGYSIIADSFPKRRRGLAFSIFASGGVTGAAVSLMLGGYLIAAIPKGGVEVPLLGHLSVWRAVFLTAGLPGLLVALLIWTVVEPPRRDRLTVPAGSFADALRYMQRNWRFYLGVFFGFAMLTMAGAAHLVWTPTYLMRRFGLDVTQVVNIMAPVGLIGGIGSMLLAGTVIDYLYARGVKDAHLRYFIVGGGVCLPVFLALAMASSRLDLFFVFMVLTQLTAGFAGIGPAALTLVTPNEYRGQISSLYLLVTGLLGAGLGPAFVGAYTTFLFQDDAKIGWAIALNGAVAAPIAGLIFFFTLKPMRRAVEQAASWSKDG